MSKIVFTFIVLATLIGLSINSVRKMTGKEKWALTKTIAYAIICSLLAIATMLSIVILF